MFTYFRRLFLKKFSLEVERASNLVLTPPKQASRAAYEIGCRRDGKTTTEDTPPLSPQALKG